MFFPAVTGIEAGLSMSGDLKNPAKALPRGTLGAVLTGYAVYMAVPIVLIHFVPDRGRLLAEPLILQSVARWGSLILLGVGGHAVERPGLPAGAPRTMQALSRDRIFPSVSRPRLRPHQRPAHRHRPDLFLVALGAILLGDLNLIAPVLSMFFLTSYGLLNLSAGLEGLIDSPSGARNSGCIRPGRWPAAPAVLPSC